MNQDQVKEVLLKIENDVPDFKVLFTGKKSKKVDGLYKPDTYEILIHNRNHETENEIVYTAIHEYAHHINCTKSAKPVTSRSHTVIFWDIFHRLLYKAEQMNIYNNIFKSDTDFQALTKNIRENYLSLNGKLMKEFGSQLIEAMRLCEEKKVSFEDYVDRELGLHRNEAKIMMKTYDMGINPDIGFDNMRTVAKVKDPDARIHVQEAFLNGNSPDMVKAEFSKHFQEQKQLSRVEFLENEKVRLEKSIKLMSEKIGLIDSQLQKLKIDDSELFAKEDD